MDRIDITRANITSNVPDPSAMFDDRSDTQTVMPDEIMVSISTPEFVDTIEIRGLDATWLHVLVLDGADEIWRRRILLNNEMAVVDYWTYFMEPIVRKTEIVVPDLPRIPNPTINIRVTGGGVAIAHLALGQARKLAAQET